MTPADVLEKAALIVEERWQQGGYGQDEGPRCAIGALLEAANDSNTETYQDARITLHDLVERTHKSVVKWNDAPERTKEEVAAKMREAAMRYREEKL